MINIYKDGRVHAYFKGILQSIYNLKNRCSKLGIARRYPTAEYALENNIAHATNVCFGNQIFTDNRSSTLGNSCVPESGLVRHSFDVSWPINQTISKQTAEKHQGNSREIATEVQASPQEIATNKPRNGKEIAENKHRKSRAEAEDCVETSRGEAKEVVFSDKLLTNFVPTSNILRVGFESASNFLRVKPYENSKPTRIKLDKKPENGRIRSEERGNKVGSRTGVSEDRLFSNSGQLRTVFGSASENVRAAKYPLITFQLPFLGQPMFGRCAGGVQEMGEVRSRFEGSTNPVPRMYCLSTVSSRGRYRKGTGSVLRSYWRATKEVLRSYWKGTTFCKFGVSSGREVGSSSLKGSLSQISSFKASKFLSQVFTHVGCDNSLGRLKHNSNLTQRVCEVVGNKSVAGLFGAGKFSIASILLLLMTLGGLISQAQTPGKESAVDGVSNLEALKPGDKIPEAVWNQTLELNYFDGRKKTIKFSDLKGKLIILDFWSTGCSACIEGIPKMELIQDRFKGKVEILMVNSKRNKDTPERIKNRFEKYKKDFNYTPSLATLLDDTLFTKLFEHNTLPSISILNTSGEFIATVNSKILTDENIKLIYDGIPLNISSIGAYVNAGNRAAGEPLFDTAGVHYLSYFSGFRDHFLPVYPNLIYKDGTTYLKMGNQNFGFFLKQAFRSEMDGFSWNQLLFDQRLGKQFKINLRNATLPSNQYWYEFYAHDSVSQNEFSEVFKKDFQQNFQVAVAVRQDSINIYRVTFSDAIQKIASREKMRIMRGSDVEREIFYQRVPIGNIINSLYYAFEFPIEIDGQRSLLVDLTIPEGFTYWETDRKLNFFKEKGIVFSLTKEKRSYPYVYSLKQSN